MQLQKKSCDVLEEIFHYEILGFIVLQENFWKKIVTTHFSLLKNSS